LQIQEQFVPETLLSKFIHDRVQSFSQLFNVKKRFITQLALSSFTGHIMCVGSRFPEKLFFSLQSGEVWQSKFFPSMYPPPLQISVEFVMWW